MKKAAVPPPAPLLNMSMDRNLYPFRFNLSDGTFVDAIKQLLGTDIRTLKDSTGKVYGPELMTPRRSRRVKLQPHVSEAEH